MFKLKWIACLPVIFFSAVINAAPSDTSSVQVVAQLYRDFAWEAVIEEPNWDGHTLVELSRASLEKYFDPKLSSLLIKDSECGQRIHEICKLDFSPIWSSQDPVGASGLKVKRTDDPSVVDVYFSYPSREVIKLTYQLKKTPRGWRISDIRNDSPADKFSLLAILEAEK
ncbi:MAG: DUF3828 domain-containing protein [Burkholderiaceae bacterium]